MSKGQYEYTVRFRGVNGIGQEIIIADRHEVDDGLVYFYDEEDEYDYVCGLNNLLDMKIRGIDSEEHTERELRRKSNSLEEAFKKIFGEEEKDKTEAVMSRDHLPNVLPKEHE